MNYGLQLYSVRDDLDKDLPGTLAKIGEIGYKFVELYGDIVATPAQLCDMLDKSGLEVHSTHSGIEALIDDFDATVRYNKEIGNKNYVLPYSWVGAKKYVDETIEKINFLQPKLEAEGIALHYHNHADELMKQDDGIIPMLEFGKRTKILFEIDTYWAFIAGEDPVEVIERFQDRIKFIHLKDGTPERDGRSLGLGDAPIKAVNDAAKRLGFEIVVESEGQKPNGIAEITRCFKYLKTIQ